jgi:PAS domain S-box-containing protein
MPPRQLSAGELRLHLAAIVDSSDDAILSKTLDGTIVSWNRGAEQLYGYTAAEVVGRHVSLLAPDDRPDEIPHILRRIAAGERVDHFDTVRVRKDGSRMPVVLSVSPIRDASGRITGASTIARDISERLLAREAEAARDRAVEASRLKSDFLAAMSHELRTPLTAIMGFSDLIRSLEVDSAGTVRAPLDWVEHVHRGAEHLVALVNDVLDLSKVEAGRLELELAPLPIASLVSETVGGLRPLAERKSLEIAVDVAPSATVHADRGRLRQILYNLLSNAIKYTPDGGRITVTARRDGGDLRLAVADTGIGIASKDQARVFEEFRQVGDPEHHREGTGLGLALTRRLVEAHGGKIELASQPGRGSIFTVVMRAVPPAEPAPSTSLAAARHAQRSKGVGLLVVEDDPGAARLLRAYLEPEGHAVRVAADGPAALAEARLEPPAAILLDVVLPGLDGWSVLRDLKADRDLRDIPVVIVTIVDEREVGLALGASDYLLKPVDRTTLLASVSRYVRPRSGEARPVRILAVDDEPAALDLIRAVLEPAGYDLVRTTSARKALELARLNPPDLMICDLVMPEVDGLGVVAALKDDPVTGAVPILILTAHELSTADRNRLNGEILGVVSKGPAVSRDLRDWLSRVAVPR